MHSTNYLHCLLCLQDSAENSRTIFYGHSHKSTKIKERVLWIHGICQNCFLTLLIEKFDCPLCRLENLCIEVIDVDSEGYVKKIRNSTDRIQKNIALVKKLASIGQQIGQIIGLFAIGGSVGFSGFFGGVPLNKIPQVADLIATGIPPEIATATLLITGEESGKAIGTSIGFFAGKTILNLAERWNDFVEEIEDIRSCGMSSLTNDSNWLD